MDAELSSAVLAAVIDPTMVIGEDGVIVYFNPAACEAFKLEEVDVIGANISMLMADSTHVTSHDQYLQNYKQTGQKKMIGRNRIVAAKRSDGTVWNASLSISEVTLSSKTFFVGTLRDVTESMKREKLFSSVIDEAIDAIFTINDKGLITLVNRSALKMFGYTEDELLGQNISILMPEPHRSAHDKYIETHMRTGVKKMIGTDRIVTACRKDKTEFKCRLGLTKIEDEGGDSTMFVGLLHDLTLELAAREAEGRVELADKMRKQKALFLASMSHEIRTPLNGIFGMLELLQSTELDDVQSEWLATCSRSAQSLTTILDDILLFSRADGGGITLERLSFNIRDTIEDAVTVMASQTDHKAVDLVYMVSRSVPDFVIGDPTRIRQVILIFLSNALKFTQVGHVALEVSLDGEDDDEDDDSDSSEDAEQTNNEEDIQQEGKILLKFEISDTGIGMSKKQIKKLFQPFTQADESTTRQYGGTGLGLSIAKKLVTLMEGHITVESRSGRGSTFTFTARVENDPHGTSASDLHDNIPEEDLELLKGTHILSIDDNAVNTDYLVNLLQLLGCDITGSRSGVDGIELLKLAALREDPYEILLLDFAMPSMSGLEVAEFVASSQSIASTHMRVIMLGSIDVHRSIAACPFVHGFTTKPIRRIPLIKMIVEQLKIKRGTLSAPKTNKPMSLREEATELPGTVTEKEPSSIRARRRPNPLSILLIEDNLINQKVVVSILTRWKCQVTTALNGLSGFEERISHRGKNKSFDLCLCDLHMPSCDGFQCVKMIREWEEANDVAPLKICALTADANPDTRDLCLSDEGGFDEFLAKPLRKNVLRDMIINVCGEDRFTVETVDAPRRPGERPHEEEVPTGASHILIVDDAPTMRLLLRTFLTGMGCTVSEASSGESAVELVRASLKDNPIEMVICDMRMPPGINGMETAKRIKQIPGTLSLPIIGMTADDVSNAALDEARENGMLSLISKPLGKSQLASFLADYTDTVSVRCEPPGTDQGRDVFEKERALENCSNDKEFLKTLLMDMAKDLNTKKEALKIAVHRKDSARVAEIAHNIKGMASICGFTRLAKAASECEQSASASNYVEVRTRSQFVLDEIARAIKVAESFDPNVD